METRRRRKGQYEFVLYRDTVYEYFDKIKVAPAYIEKATLPLNNPLIYNSETTGCNQIKTNETLLKDEFGTPWYIAYIKEDQGAIDVSIPDASLVPDITINGLTDYEYNIYTTQDFIGEPLLPTFAIRAWSEGSLFGFIETYWFGWDSKGNSKFFPKGEKDKITGYTIQSGEAQGIERLEFNSGNKDMSAISALAQKESWEDEVYQFIPNSHSQYTTSQFLKENGKILFDTLTNKYYKVRVGKIGQTQVDGEVPDLSNIGQKMASIAKQVEVDGKKLFNTDSRKSNPYVVSGQASVYRITYDELPNTGITMKIPAAVNRQSCKNQPYDILAFPADSFGTTSVLNLIYGKELAAQMAETLVKALGSNLIDIQLVPYCPLPNIVADSGVLDISNLTSKDLIIWERTVEDDEPQKYYGISFFLSTGDFTANIPGVEIKAPETPIECKVMNETKMYRFVSPNYNGMFEINPAKNKGIRNIKADVTYKPFSPYIRVYPEFNGLYGDNFGDCRGLICGGDFSLPQVQSAWIEYQLQNKNYQVMFDRQITNLERNNKWNMTEAAVNAVTGTLSGGATGAMLGSAFGPVGIGVGGGVAGVASAVGGIADIALLQKRQQETLDYTKDLFSYNLQNIQAQPDNITKFSSFNINNKVFPILEEYSATTEEEEQLKNKIKYNGMTVMTIGKIEDYIQKEESYIKARLIRLDLEEDYHMATVIAEEINKGVYV